MTPHYKIVEIGGEKLVIFYPQYKDDDGYKIIDPENRFPIELKNHDEYMSFLETLIEREQELKDGLTTLADLIEEMDMLARGPKGDTRYMWIKYADDDKGNGMSDDPTGKKYIGFAFNKDTETPSEEPSDYKFVKYVADYEGLEIGGRNLLRNSEKIVVNKGLERINLTVPIKKGSDLVISGNYTVLEGDPEELSVRIRDKDGAFVSRGIKNITIDESGFFEVVFADVAVDIYQIILYSGKEYANENVVEYSFVSLYRGNIPMDWSPAPEDIYELIDDIDAEHVGLGNVQNYGIASQSQAENGTSNSAYMTPLRTKQAIDAQRPITIPRLSADVPGDNYPSGLSFMDIGGNGTSDGYPQNYGYVMTYKTADNRMSQEFVGNGYNSSQETRYMRYYHPNNDYNGWTPWQESVFVLSHSVGNDYGCIKYSDGMMECWARIELTRQANARMGGYWTFDYEFAGNPNITFSIDYTDSSITPSVFALSALYIRSLSNKVAEFAVGRIPGETDFEDGDIMHVFAKATGRWR